MTALTRRQMLRQQSYKMAQQTQILPPLPLAELGESYIEETGPCASNNAEIQHQERLLVQEKYQERLAAQQDRLHPLQQSDRHMSKENFLPQDTEKYLSLQQSPQRSCNSAASQLAKQEWTNLTSTMQNACHINDLMGSQECAHITAGSGSGRLQSQWSSSGHHLHQPQWLQSAPIHQQCYQVYGFHE